MEPISIDRTHTDGLETVHASNGRLALSLVPALGGKINSLRDLTTGREWLWRNPRLPYRRVRHGSSYVKSGDTGGWDECFPSVSACTYPSAPFRGAVIQDHGELWSQATSLTTDQHGETLRLHTQWRGIALPYLFERTIGLAPASPRLHFEYRVTNTGDAPLHWIWSAHPLMAIAPGMRLRVPPSARFHLDSIIPGELSARTSGLEFPMSVQGLDLSVLPPVSAGIAMKLWSDPLDAGWATLAAPDGEFRLYWDPACPAQVGLWMNLGAWSGDGAAPYYNLGLEPCIGAQDSLADAITKYDLFQILPAGALRSWWLDVELGQAPDIRA